MRPQRSRLKLAAASLALAALAVTGGVLGTGKDYVMTTNGGPIWCCSG